MSINKDKRFSSWGKILFNITFILLKISLFIITILWNYIVVLPLWSIKSRCQDWFVIKQLNKKKSFKFTFIFSSLGFDVMSGWTLIHVAAKTSRVWILVQLFHCYVSVFLKNILQVKSFPFKSTKNYNSQSPALSHLISRESPKCPLQWQKRELTQ